MDWNNLANGLLYSAQQLSDMSSLDNSPLTIDAELNAPQMDDINITPIKAFISSFANKAINRGRGICKVELILLRWKDI